MPAPGGALVGLSASKAQGGHSAHAALRVHPAPSAHAEPGACAAAHAGCSSMPAAPAAELSESDHFAQHDRHSSTVLAVDGAVIAQGSVQAQGSTAEPELERASVGQVQACALQPPTSVRRGSNPLGLQQRCRGWQGAVQVTVIAACFSVDVLNTLHLWWLCASTHAMVAPHLDLYIANFALTIFLAGLRAFLVSSAASVRQWLFTFAQMLWCVPPLRVTSQLTLRAAPRWGPYAAIILGVGSNVLILLCVTAALVAPDRGERYIWRSSQARIAVSWAMTAVHVGLICAVFAMQRRTATLALSAQLQGSMEEAGCGAATAKDGVAERESGLEMEEVHLQ
eukprot:jgi/Ulvmu1/1656/UM114_0025.1